MAQALGVKGVCWSSLPLGLWWNQHKLTKCRLLTLHSLNTHPHPKYTVPFLWLIKPQLSLFTFFFCLLFCIKWRHNLIIPALNTKIFFTQITYALKVYIHRCCVFFFLSYQRSAEAHRSLLSSCPQGAASLTLISGCKSQNTFSGA